MPKFRSFEGEVSRRIIRVQSTQRNGQKRIDYGEAAAGDLSSHVIESIYINSQITTRNLMLDCKW